MTLRDMQIFLQVADTGKMSEAARDLNISQSSVSQVITNIEREYKVQLFERLSKRLYVTPVGEKMLDYVRHILSMKNALEDCLSNPTEIRRICIGATITVGHCVIIPVIEELRATFPQKQPEVVIANTHILEEKILRSEIDIGLIEGRIKNPTLVCVPVIDDSLVLACGRNHPFFGRNLVSLSELAGQSFVMREQGSGTRAQLENELKTRAIPYKVTWESYSPTVIRNSVVAGCGITVISELLIRKECKEGLLWSCNIEDMPLKRSFDLVYHKNKFISEDIRDFMSICRRYGDEKRRLDEKEAT